MILVRKLVFLFVLLIFSSSSFATHYYRYIVKDIYLGNICFSFTNGSERNDYYDWNYALINAINKYNSTFGNTKLGMGYNCSGTYNVQLRFRDDGESGYVAITEEFHTWTKEPADYVTLNTGSSDFNALMTLDEKSGLLMHEMGHVIGINHTEYGSGTAISITYSDPSPETSLFRPEELGESILSPVFSLYDRFAILWLYN